MAEVFETFATYLTRLEKLEAQFQDKPIVVSSDLIVPKLFDGDDDSIVKTRVAWPLHRHNMFYTVKVPGGKHIPKHSHEEDIFRYVISGALTVNGREIRTGEWFVIRNGTPYEIFTAEGYTTFGAYTSICRTRRGLEGKHLEEEMEY